MLLLVLYLYTCTYAGASPLHSYATNSLSWTCKIGDDNKVDNAANDDVNNAADQADDDVDIVANKAFNVHVPETPVLAPTDKGKY